MIKQIVIPSKQIAPKIMVASVFVAAMSGAVQVNRAAAATSLADPITPQEKEVICGTQIPQYESQGWRFVMNFNNNQAVGCMVSPVISYLGTAYAQSIVPCQVVGDVVISGGSAKFNGGYIRCDNFNPPGEGIKNVTYFDMHVWAKNIGYQSASNNNPVFYHPNVSLHIPTAMHPIGKKMYGLTTRRGVTGLLNTAPKIVAPFQNGWYWFASQRFEAGLVHTLGNVSISPIAGLASAPFSFNHNPQTIYIGYEPGHTPTVFYGEIDEITVDPQYGGDCC